MIHITSTNAVINGRANPAWSSVVSSWRRDVKPYGMHDHEIQVSIRSWCRRGRISKMLRT